MVYTVKLPLLLNLVFFLFWVGQLSSLAMADPNHGTIIQYKLSSRLLGKVNFDTEQTYISEDGTRIARYWNGGRNIEIAHLSKHTGVQYTYDADDGNGWQKHEVPGHDLGIQALLMFDKRAQIKNGDARYVGDTKIAGLPCKKFTYKAGISWCRWQRENQKIDKRFPVSINLASRIDFPKGDYSEQVVQSIQFDVALDAQKLSPPLDVLKQPLHDPTNDKENATNAWCRAEKKKTLVDPCMDDQDDGQDNEEAWDVE